MLGSPKKYKPQKIGLCVKLIVADELMEFRAIIYEGELLVIPIHRTQCPNQLKRSGRVSAHGRGPDA